MTEKLDSISRVVMNQPWIVTCHDCKMAFRLENLTPFTTAVREFHCPCCGSVNVTEKTNYEDNRWMALGESFGLPRSTSTVAIIKELFEIWNPDEFYYFKDFVKDVVEHALQAPLDSGDSEGAD